jgi:actin-related protein
VLKIIKRVKNGYFQDFSMMEKLYGYIFNQLNIETKNYSMIIAEPPLSTKQYKENVFELLTEKFDVPGKNE